MPCKDETEKNDDAWSVVLDADAALEKARRKLENRLKAAGAACAFGAVAAAATGLPGLLGGGATCIAALLVADDAAADYEYAITQSELASEKHSRALIDELMCLSRCSPVEVQPNS